VTRFEQSNGYIYIIPAFLMVALVLCFPYMYGFYLSFHSVSPMLETTFTGFANYLKALSDPVFWVALRNVLIIVIASEIGGFILGFAGALVLRKGGAVSSVLRVVLLLPWAIPGVVTSLTWLWIFDGHFGILNQMLVGLGLSSGFISWLGDSSYAMIAVVVVSIWRGFSFILVMLLAGLQAIPEELYEAAAVDGARSWHQFYYITLPSLKQIIAITLILTTISNFKTFDLIWVLTGGGPGYATEVLSSLIYRTSFTHLDFGYAASIAVLMALVMIVPIVLYVRMINRKDPKEVG
jgi:multiple sugar transport system permease protein